MARFSDLPTELLVTIYQYALNWPSAARVEISSIRRHKSATLFGPLHNPSTAPYSMSCVGRKFAIKRRPTGFDPGDRLRLMRIDRRSRDVIIDRFKMQVTAYISTNYLTDSVTGSFTPAILRTVNVLELYLGHCGYRDVDSTNCARYMKKYNALAERLLVTPMAQLEKLTFVLAWQERRTASRKEGHSVSLLEPFTKLRARAVELLLPQDYYDRAFQTGDAIMSHTNEQPPLSSLMRKRVEKVMTDKHGAELKEVDYGVLRLRNRHVTSRKRKREDMAQVYTDVIRSRKRWFDPIYDWNEVVVEPDASEVAGG